MSPRQYENFDLLVESVDGGEFRALVTQCPLDESPSARFTMPFDPTRLENLLLKLDPGRSGTRRVATDPASRAAQEFGVGLFDAVFQEDIRLAWQRSLDVVGRERGLRLRLRLNDAPTLAGLPWELLHDTRGRGYLAQSEQTPVVRFIDLPQPPRPLVVGGALRILAVIASPTDLPALDVEAEWAALRRSLADPVAAGTVHLDRLERPMMSELAKWLRTNSVHVLHFVGHGAYDVQHQDGVIYMSDKYGRSSAVSSAVLGPYSRDHDALRLIVLNACHTARTDADDPFSGMAQSLVRQDTAAVVAMQFPISDEAAASFSGGFYGALADGLPIDQAATAARKELIADFATEWATPVLFLRAPDGKIFADITPVPEEEAAAVVAAPEAEPVPQPEPLVEPVPRRSLAAVPRVDVAARRAPVAEPHPEPEVEPYPPADLEPDEDEDVDQPQLVVDVRVPPRRRPRGVLAGVGAGLAALALGGGWWVTRDDPLPPPVASTKTGSATTTANPSASASPTTSPSPSSSGPSTVRLMEPAVRLTAKRLGSPPTLDGDPSEWAEVPVLVSDAVVYSRTSGSPTIAGRWRLGWDSAALYFFVEVTDPRVEQLDLPDNSQLYKGDGVGFEIGTWAARVSTTTLPSRDLNVLFGITDGVERPTIIGAVNGPKGANFEKLTDLTVDGTGVITSEGYRIEAAVPWERLNVTSPQRGTLLSMNLTVSDGNADTRGLRTMVSNNPERTLNDAKGRYRWGQLALR
ncbi:CHAT domain-containing protein [Knoellia locipacati]|uniref:CHAT domain-containing protein n=1 Tax=Knoellia locipacati TaxID=882824 RepID=UPI00384C9DF1